MPIGHHINRPSLRHEPPLLPSRPPGLRVNLSKSGAAASIVHRGVGTSSGSEERRPQSAVNSNAGCA
jgi:hypothetical protein